MHRRDLKAARSRRRAERPKVLAAPGASILGSDLIIFDCDGVLVDSELLSARGFRAVLEEISVDIPAGVLESSIGLKQADIIARIAHATGRDIGGDAIAHLWPRTRELFEAELQPTPGLIAFLDRLDIARCVASSSHVERIRWSLGLTRLDRYFGDAIFSTHEVANGKPAPDIFLHAAKAMGVDPARSVVIEDSLAGVRGAVAAGMRVVGFLGGQHIGRGHGAALREAGAAFVTPHWSSVARWLARTRSISK
jgi:HAD superfamily hydrolase (TIGR01509 family)